MTHQRRIAKLEFQLAQTRNRLAARNTECVLLLDQIVQLKEALAEHGLEVTFNETAFTDASQTFHPVLDPHTVEADPADPRVEANPGPSIR